MSVITQTVFQIDRVTVQRDRIKTPRGDMHIIRIVARTTDNMTSETVLHCVGPDVDLRFVDGMNAEVTR